MNKRKWIRWMAIISFAMALSLGCRTANDDTEPDANNNFDAGHDTDTGQLIGCPDGSPDPFNSQLSPYFGGEESVDLEVIEFADFRCSHCANYAEDVDALWAKREDYRKRVRFYFHHFCRTSTPKGIHAATRAAHLQGMEHFWSMHDYIFDGMNADPPVVYTEEQLRTYAQDVLGLDMAQYDADVANPTTIDYLNWDKQQAKDEGVTGTPAVFICGKKIQRWKIEEIIDGYLNL